MATIEELKVKIRVQIVRVVRNPNHRWWKPWHRKEIEILFDSVEAALGKAIV